MSERILTLFGEEIVPEQEKPAGKSRAKKSPKEKTPETTADQNEPERTDDAHQQKAEITEPGNIPAVITEEPQAKTELSQPVTIPEENDAAISAGEPEEIIAQVAEEPQPAAITEEEPTYIPASEQTDNEVPEEKPVTEQTQEAVAAEETIVEKAKKEPKQKKTVNKQPIAEAPRQEGEEEESVTVNKKPVQANLPEDWEGDKQYYSIGEVAALFKVKTSHIRFWTNEFKLKVRTNRKGDRLYTPAQIKELRAIHHLVKERGFTLSGAKAKMKTQNKMDVETIDLKQSLIQLRSKLLTIKNQLK